MAPSTPLAPVAVWFEMASRPSWSPLYHNVAARAGVQQVAQISRSPKRLLWHFAAITVNGPPIGTKTLSNENHRDAPIHGTPNFEPRPSWLRFLILACVTRLRHHRRHAVFAEFQPFLS